MPNDSEHLFICFLLILIVFSILRISLSETYKFLFFLAVRNNKINSFSGNVQHNFWLHLCLTAVRDFGLFVFLGSWGNTLPPSFVKNVFMSFCLCHSISSILVRNLGKFKTDHLVLISVIIIFVCEHFVCLCSSLLCLFLKRILKYHTYSKQIKPYLKNTHVT